MKSPFVTVSVVAALVGALISLGAGTSAQADTIYDWSFNCGVASCSGSGTLTTPTSTLPQVANGITGSWGGSSITALESFYGNDNKLLALSPSAALDYPGISFVTSGGLHVNLYHSANYGFVTCQIITCQQPDTAGGGSFETFTLSLAPVVTPLPGALPLFATGLGALSLLGWRRKRKAKAA